MATEVNISAYSGSVSAGDWGPAIVAAVADIVTTGGTVNIDTNITIKSTVNLEQSGNYISLHFKSDGGNTITINGASNIGAIMLGNNVISTITNLIFLGKQLTGGTADCSVVIWAGTTERVVVDQCLFAGVYADAAIIKSVGATELIVRDCKFGGCAATTAHIEFNAACGLEVERCEFYDYQNFRAAYYDRQGPRDTWIKALNPPANNATNLGLINISQCRFDEGAAQSIVIDSYPRVVIDQCSSNLNALGAAGIDLVSVANAKINQYWGGFNTVGDAPAVEVTTCGNVEIDGLTIHNGPHPVVIDAGSTFTKIVNSPDATVTPASGAKYSLNGVNYKGTVRQVG